MNRIVNSIKQHWRLCLLGLVVLTLVGLGLRLAQGPMRIDGFKSLIISRLEREVVGSQASLGHLDLVWFHDANAMGLRFEDMELKDAQKRVVASAASLEAALALDSLLGLHLAPARLTAEDFFVAVSVSTEGRYELGYDAKGDRQAFAFDQVFRDLTGPETLGRPISYTRQFSLRDGTISLRQVGSDLNWRAQVAHIDFSKHRNRIAANIGLVINADGDASYLTGRGEALTNLKEATLEAEIRDLVPASVFPSIGITQPLANFRAKVNGKGNIRYSAKKGVETAFVDIAAGEGAYLFGKSEQAFDALNIKADFVPATKTVRFKTFQLQSRFLDTDLHGTVFISPEDVKRRKPMSVEFDFSGPRVTGKLAEDFQAQTLTDVHFKGAYKPDLRQLDIESGRGFLAKAPIETRGRLYTNDAGQLGADLTAEIKGNFTKEQVFAFWPETMTPITRGELIKRIKGGVYSNADFVLKAPPGRLKPNALTNEDLRLEFDFRDMELMFHSKLKDAHGLKGKGVLQGNRFDLSLSEGFLVEVPLRDGGISVPNFHERNGGKTHIWLKTQSGAAQLIEAIDPLTGNTLTRGGLNRARLSGTADVQLDLSFPTFTPLTERNLDLTFEGTIREAGLKEAALGWDMVRGDLRIAGDFLKNSIHVYGPAELGPYAGEVSYRTQFDPKMQYIDFDGSFNARQFGGSPTRRVAVKGQLEVFNNVGKGTVTSDIFNGTVNWRGEEARPSQVTIAGVTLSTCMKEQGLPIFSRFTPEIPTQINLLRSGDIWSGNLEAEGFSGDLAYVEGQNPRLVYKALITPERARMLGLGALPVFQETRRLSVNIGLDAESREARIRLDDIDAVLDWTEDDGQAAPLRTLEAVLTPEQMHRLGLPKGWFAPRDAMSVTAKWAQDPKGISGVVMMGTQALRFELPDTEAEAFLTGEAKPWAQIVATIDERFLERLGYINHSLDVKGQTDLTLSLFQTRNPIEGAVSPTEISAAVINIDAKAAELRLARSDWIKPAGEAANLVLSLDERDGGGVNMSRIYATGDRITLEGRASFKKDGTVDFADFSQIYLRDFANLTAKLYEIDASEARILSISGRRLDLRPWFNPSKLKGAPTTVVIDNRPMTPPAVDEATVPVAQKPLRLLMKLDILRTSNEGMFTDAELEVDWDGQNRLKGEGSALTDHGTLVTLDFKPEVDYTRFVFEADDLGDLVRTGVGDKRLVGGTAVIEGTYRDGQVDASFKGEDLKVKQIPALAQVLTLASLQGLSDTLTGEGISFDEYEFPVRYRDQFLFVKDGWAKGQALRINVWGASDFKRQVVSYEGTIIPAYGVNALFSGVPLVGDIITSTSGEGVLGLKYKLKGRFDAPHAEINPFSLMLPGFFRRLLDEDQSDLLPPIAEAEGKRKSQ